MGKIETITRWSAKAALHSALESVEEGDGVLILIEGKEGQEYGYRSANLSNAGALYLIEKCKFDIFFEVSDG